MLVACIGTHQRDRNRRAGQVVGVAASPGELLQPLSVGDRDERPALLVLGAAGAPSGVQDAIEVL